MVITKKLNLKIYYQISSAYDSDDITTAELRFDFDTYVHWNARSSSDVIESLSSATVSQLKDAINSKIVDTSIIAANSITETEANVYCVENSRNRILEAIPVFVIDEYKYTIPSDGRYLLFVATYENGSKLTHASGRTKIYDPSGTLIRNMSGSSGGYGLFYSMVPCLQSALMATASVQTICRLVTYIDGSFDGDIFTRSGRLYAYEISCNFNSSGNPVSFWTNNYNSYDNFDDVFNWLNSIPNHTPPQPDDPFSPGGTSEPGGGGGTFDDSSDSVPDSPLPTLSAANTGFTRIYNPTLEQVQAMANYLWTDETVIETIWNHIKQFLENPMEAFIGFNLVPCEVPDGGTQEFKVMYIGTGVNMTVAANQFVDVDCGTVTVEPYYGSALDYAPYTRISCFLPYIGQVDLDTDEVMGATLQIKYRIDIVTGSCVAKIFVDGNVVYQYSGHCAINIPFTSADFSNYVSAIISIAKLAVGAAAAGAAGALAGGASEAPTMQLTGQTIEKYTSRNPATGRQITTGTFTRERYSMQGGDGGTKASFNALSPSNIANTVGQVMSSKPAIEHAGSFSGNSGYLGVRRPFLDITRPRMCNPSEYGKYNGYPAMLTLQLGNCTGFTQVQQIQLTGLNATNPEQAEILSLLKTGVIL